jgi:formate dehydrogenase subunit gamma
MNRDEQVLHEIIARHAGQRGPLLPILHDVQDAFGCVPAETVPVIAKALNLSRAEVHGTISFYHDFRSEPAAKPVVKLCRAEACQARGVEQLAPLFDADQRIETETVYCLGLCASGPNAMVGTDVFARLDADKVRKLIDQAALA